MKPRGPQSRAAFTVVELIVATAITVALAATMIAIVSSILSSWSRSTSSLRLNNDTKIALDTLTQDLQAAVVKMDGNVWFAASIQPDQTTAEGDSGASSMAIWTATAGGTTKSGIGTVGDSNSSLQLAPSSLQLSDYRFGMAGVWLRFFASVRGTNDSDLKNASVPRAIGYQIIRHEVKGSGSIRYSLFRSEVRPFDSDVQTRYRSTFYVGFDAFAAAYNDPSTVIVPPAGSGASNETALFGSREPGGIRRPDRTHRVFCFEVMMSAGV